MTSAPLYRRTAFVGLLSFLVLVSISGAITTFVMQSLVVYLRLVAGLVLISSVAVVLLKFGVKRTQVYSIYILVLIFAYGALLTVFMGSYSTGFVNFERDLLVGVLGVMALGVFVADSDNSRSLVRAYCLYAVFVLLLTIWGGGLTLEFPPTFRFEYIATSLGSVEGQTYSLGVSNFFGFAAISAALLASREERIGFSILGFFLTFLFLILSMLGGGRGESLAALVVVVLLFTRKIWLTAVLMCLLGGFYSFGLDLIGGLESDFLFVKRFIVLFEGNLSSRDFLLRQGYDLLRENSQCLLIGCGFGYFQQYYQYGFEYYPHNVFVESVISFGLPLVLLGLLCAFGGLVLHIRKLGTPDLLTVFFGYALLVSLKSGYLLGSWMVVALLCYFVAVAVESYLDKARSGLYRVDL